MYTLDDMYEKNLVVRFEQSGSDIYMDFVTYLYNHERRWAGGEDLLTDVYNKGGVVFLGHIQNKNDLHYSVNSESTWVEKYNKIVVRPEEFDFMEKWRRPLTPIEKFILCE